MIKGLTPLEALEVIYNSQDIMGGHDDFWKAFRVIEKAIEAIKIIKEHKLLNYVFKNKKCANMYHLSEEEKETLKKELYYETQDL